MISQGLPRALICGTVNAYLGLDKDKSSSVLAVYYVMYYFWYMFVTENWILKDTELDKGKASSTLVLDYMWCVAPVEIEIRKLNLEV